MDNKGKCDDDNNIESLTKQLNSELEKKMLKDFPPEQQQALRDAVSGGINQSMMTSHCPPRNKSNRIDDDYGR